MKLGTITIEIILTSHQLSVLFAHPAAPLNKNSSNSLYTLFKEIKGARFLKLEADENKLAYWFDGSKWEGFEKSLKAVETLIYEYL